MYFIVYVFAMLTYIKSKTSSTSLTDGTKTKITGVLTHMIFIFIVLIAQHHKLILFLK